MLHSIIHPMLVNFSRLVLVKYAKLRWHAAADVHVEIETILAESQGLKTADFAATRLSRWRLSAIIAITAAATTLVITGIEWSLRPKRPSMSIARFSYLLPEGQSLTRGGRHVIAISPDGENIV